MLPTGHIAAGYLMTHVLVDFISPGLNDSQIARLFWFGAFASFAPDLDVFIAFLKNRRFSFKDGKINHRKFISHAPIVWFIIGLGIYFAVSNPFVRLLGLLLWMGSWSHFLLDSLHNGIMWLWPFSLKPYAFKDAGREMMDKYPVGFFNFWLYFLVYYIKESKLSFFTELFLIVGALLVFIK